MFYLIYLRGDTERHVQARFGNGASSLSCVWGTCRKGTYTEDSESPVIEGTFHLYCCVREPKGIGKGGLGQYVFFGPEPVLDLYIYIYIFVT